MTPTNTYRIWIAGNYDDAVRTVREYCAKQGDCYAVSPCDYVYSGGLEAGVCVTRINYARFPASDLEIASRVNALALHLADRLFQKSFSIEGPRETTWVKMRGPWDA